MEFDWDNIKYIFQIPVQWFMSIHNRVFKAFGSNFIRVKEDTDSGGMWIDIDPDSFADAVNSVSSAGTVKSVDDIEPDQNGNVSFQLDPDKYLKSDSQGHITTTDDTPISIDTSQYTPRSGTCTVTTDVVWDGTNLKYSSYDLVFENGVLVDVEENNDELIDTPVVITWS